jgi:hypothetical protein
MDLPISRPDRIRRILRNISPRIIEAIADGRQPVELTVGSPGELVFSCSGAPSSRRLVSNSSETSIPAWAFVRSNREGANDPRSGPGPFDEPRPRSDSTFDQNYFAAFASRVRAVFLSCEAEP